MVGVFPADVSLLAGVGLGLLIALELMVWFDLPKGRPDVNTPLSETIAAVIDLDRAHGEATAKADAAAKARAEADAATATAATKHQQLRDRLAAAYPIPGGTPPAGSQPPAAPVQAPAPPA